MCYLAIKRKYFGGNKKEFAKNQGTFTEEIKRIEYGGLSTYDLCANDKYNGVYLSYADFTFNLVEIRKKKLFRKASNVMGTLRLSKITKSKK